MCKTCFSLFLSWGSHMNIYCWILWNLSSSRRKLRAVSFTLGKICHRQRRHNRLSFWNLLSKLTSFRCSILSIRIFPMGFVFCICFFLNARKHSGESMRDCWQCLRFFCLQLLSELRYFPFLCECQYLLFFMFYLWTKLQNLGTSLNLTSNDLESLIRLSCNFQRIWPMLFLLNIPKLNFHWVWQKAEIL